MGADVRKVSLTSTQRAWTEEATREHVQSCLRQGIRAAYQPIVDLGSGATVGLEALARPPADSPFESPGPLFVAARRVGLLSELDAACRNAALRGALDAGLQAGVSVFVNAEPAIISAATPEAARAMFELPADCALKPVLEITERALSDRPAELLAALVAARQAGWSIAVDDVGVNPDTLALLPFIRPNIVRLDASLIQAAPARKVAFVAAAVREYTERSGALVLAECIEHERHLDRAHALGASLGQGWLFGRPGPISSFQSNVTPMRDLTLTQPKSPSTSPFQTVRDAGVETRIASKSVLMTIAQHMEAEARADVGRPVVLSAFQRAAHFTPATADRYAQLARRCAFVAVFGAGIRTTPVSGVRGIPIPNDDLLGTEWSVVIAGPRYSAALVARDLGDSGHDRARRFEFAVTHRTGLVHAAAGKLMRRIVIPGGAA